MPIVQTTLSDLKTALRLDGLSVAEWARPLRNPEGQPVDRSNIYHAINNGSPQWLLDEIHHKIQHSRRKFPEYWQKKRPQQ